MRLVTWLAALAAATIYPTAVSADVLCVQSMLNEMHFNPGPADGALGRRTRAAADLWAVTAGESLPELTDQTSAEWCTALTRFAATPEAATVFADSGTLLTSTPDENTGFDSFSWIGDRKPHSYRHERSLDGHQVAGTYVDRFEIRDGDCGRTGDYNDCAHDREHIGWNEEGATPLGDEVWHSFSLMMPESPAMQDVNTILIEWRPTGPGQINFAIELQRGQLVATVGAITVEQEDDMEPPPLALWRSLGYLTPGKWYDFTLKAIWSRGDDGHLLLTQDGRTAVDFKGTNTAFTKAVHMQYGLYRPFVGNFDGVLPTQVIYFDNVHKAAGADGLPSPGD